MGSTAMAGSTLRVGATAATASGGMFLVSLRGLTVPAISAATSGKWQILSENSTAAVASVTVNVVSGRADLAILTSAAPLQLPASQTFLIQLLNPATASGSSQNCSVLCCSKDSCGGADGCGGLGRWYACFRLEYWDDAAPYLVSAAPSSG